MRGFTLIELVIVMTIVGILSTLAWPGYANIMHRSLRMEARLALLRVQQLQERHFASYNRYASALAAPADADGLQVPSLTESGNYILLLQTADDGQFFVAVARAAPTGRQLRDTTCRLFSVDAAGVRRFAGSDELWQIDQEGKCWG